MATTFSSRYPCTSFSCEILSVCCLKYPYSGFSSNFYFLFFVVLLDLMLLLLMTTVNCLPLTFLMHFSSVCINTFMQFSMQANPLLPSFLVTYCQSVSSFSCKAFCIVINFLLLWCICLNFSIFIILIIIIKFFIQTLTCGFHCSLSDSKSPQDYTLSLSLFVSDYSSNISSNSSSLFFWNMNHSA